jgi:hypothetical protein
MKTNNSRILLLIALISLVAVGFVSADETEDCSWTADTVVDLKAGEGSPGAGENVGSVATSIEGDNLVVTFTTTGDWKLYETHLYVGSEAPSDSGPGQLGYKHEDLGGVTTDTYYIPLSTFDIVNPCCEDCEETLYVAAHAEVKKVADGVIQDEQTAWGWGDDPFGNNWARYITVLLTCVCDGEIVEEPELECFDETVWAAQTAPGETRFIPNPGNWATYITYNIGDGSEESPAEYPLYAGQYHLAGTLLVYDDNGKLYAKYVTSGEDGDYMDGYTGNWSGLSEYHLHVVDELDHFNDVRTYNRNMGTYGAPIPGQFEYSMEYDENTADTGWIEVDIDGYTDPIYIAAHGVMWWCGYPETN